MTRTPGPDARQAYRLGMLAALVVAIAGIAVLYWMDLAPLELLGFIVLLCVPVYLVFVASALSVWLGYDKDVTDLRPVYRN